MPASTQNIATVPSGVASAVAVTQVPFVTVSPTGLATGAGTANNGASYGPDSHGTTTSGINEALAAVAAGGHVDLMPGVFNISAPVVISKAVTVQGAGCSANYGSQNTAFNTINLPVAAPYFSGSVINQLTAGDDAVQVKGAGEQVNLRDFGITFVTPFGTGSAPRAIAFAGNLASFSTLPLVATTAGELILNAAATGNIATGPATGWTVDVTPQYIGYAYIANTTAGTAYSSAWSQTASAWSAVSILFAAAVPSTAVAVVSHADGTFSASPTVTLNGVTAGNILVAVYGGPSSSAPVDTYSSHYVWTKVATSASGNNQNVDIWVGVGGGGGNGAFSVTKGAGGSGCLQILQLSGTAATPVDSVTPSGTGHGVNATPTAYSTGQDNGPLGSVWENVQVFGHDGAHYGFYVVNPLYCSFRDLRAFGGGCVAIVCNSTIGNYGGLVLDHCYGQVFCEGAAYGFYLWGEADTLSNVVLIRPQATTSSLIATFPAAGAPNAGQNMIYCGTNVPNITVIGGDFETDATAAVVQPPTMWPFWFDPSSIVPAATVAPSAAPLWASEPPTSATIQTALGNLALGTNWHNTLTYDVWLTVYVAVTVNTSLVLKDGVGPSSGPTQTTIITGTTALGIVAVRAKVPAGYYRLLSVSGTETSAIVGQYLEAA